MVYGPSAALLIEKLGLLPHPEGGHYKETYRAPRSFSREALGPSFDGARACSTAIYFLIPRGEFSAFHRIRSDEVWHFYMGAPLDVICLSEEGRSVLRLGHDLAGGEVPQAVVPAGVWFASRLADAKGASSFDYSLVGCTVSPGFDFHDFELARREELATAFPQHRPEIESLTRG